MALRKLFIIFSEGIVLAGVVFLVNANLFISAYYYAIRFMDKLKALI